MDARDRHLEQLIKSAINECRHIQESAKSNGPVWLVDSTNEAISAMSGYLEYLCVQVGYPAHLMALD